VRPTTVQDLLRHTSGLSYDFIATGLLKQVYTDAQLHRRDQTNAEFCRALAALPLLHQPGTHWSYSHATDVLGRLVEAISGKPLGDFLAERILGPLGMADTAFSVPPQHHDRLAEPFAKDPEAGTDVNLYDPRPPARLQSGGGGLLSTAADYVRFLEMLAGRGSLGGARILGRKTLEFMTSNHLAADVAIDQALGLLPPGHGFGLGFAVRTEPGIASVPGSVGTYNWGGIAGTVFWVDPSEDLFALLMIQAPGQREYCRMLFRNLVYAALA
jgi:CubicO group peptidase (beta-lactamase class C family)